MSHSKRNTSLAFFTSYERSLLKGDYGKQRTRLTRDSFKPFDACNLCLMRSRDPVSCPDGHLFCRECAVENLISQRNEIKRLQSDMERQMKGDEELQILENDEATVQSVKDFELLQMGLEIPNNTQWNRKLMPNGDTEPHEPITESRGMKRKFELDKEKIVRTSNEERKKVKAALSEERTRASISKLPSFWVPSLTPSAPNTIRIRKPTKLNPFCPASVEGHIHYFSLKSLLPVKFKEDKDEKTAHGDLQRICPACRKGLSNSTKAMFAKPCGHVFCKPCVDKFMTPMSDNQNDQSKKLVQCYVCDADLLDRGRTSEKHMVRPGLVLIKSDGTGFSAGGGIVTTEKQGIAFQC